MARQTGSVYRDARNGVWVAAVALILPSGLRKVVKRSSAKRATAQSILRDMRRELDAHGDIISRSPTVEAWCTEWLEGKWSAHLAPNTRSGYERDITKRIIPAIGRIRLDKLRPSHVHAVHDECDRQGLSQTTALLVHRVLARVLKDAVRAGHMRSNPADRQHSQAPAKSTKRVELPTVQAAIKLLRLAARNKKLGLRWILAALLGLRKGEALGLTFENVHLDAKTLTVQWQMQRLKSVHGCGNTCGQRRTGDCPQAVPFGVNPNYEYVRVRGSLFLVRPKSKSGWRVLPLTDELVAMLRVHMGGEYAGPQVGEHRLLWAFDGDILTPEMDQTLWERLRSAAGLPTMHLHHLRHMTATLLMAAGVPETVRVAIMGHSTAKTTAIYEHSDLGLAAEALAKVSERLAITR